MIVTLIYLGSALGNGALFSPALLVLFLIADGAFIQAAETFFE